MEDEAKFIPNIENLLGLTVDITLSNKTKISGNIYTLNQKSKMLILINKLIRKMKMIILILLL